MNLAHFPGQRHRTRIVHWWKTRAAAAFYVLLMSSLFILPAAQSVGVRPLAVSGVNTGAEDALISRATQRTSGNWAGYVYCANGESTAGCAAGTAQVTGDFGCWNVPTVAESYGLGSGGVGQALSQWIGVGGYDGQNDLIQIGTTTSPGSAPSAWWETLPAAEISIAMNVNIGNLVCGQIALVGYNLWGQQLWYTSLRDYSNGQFWDNWWDLDVCGGAVFWPSCSTVIMASAEWVLETPELNGQTTLPPATSAVYFSSLIVQSGGEWQDVGGLSGAGHSIILDMLGGETASRSWYGAMARLTTWDRSMLTVEITGLNSLSNGTTMASTPQFPPESPGAVPVLTAYDLVSVVGGIAMLQALAVLKYRAYRGRHSNGKSRASFRSAHSTNCGAWLRRISLHRGSPNGFGKARKPIQPWPSSIPKLPGPRKVPIFHPIKTQSGGM
jgi:hypothetical protein